MKQYNIKKIYIILISLIISIGICLGLIISIKLDNNILNKSYYYIIKYITNYNKYILSSTIYQIIILSIIYIFSYSIIFNFISVFLIFLENMSIGLILGIFLKKKMLKGLIYSSIYITLNKVLYLFILIYILYNCINYTIRLIKYLKSNDNIISIIKINSKRFIICIIILILYNVINYFLLNKILKLFIFLI